MRNLLLKYRSSKYRCFINGLIFASLSAVALFLCINFILDNTATRFEVLFPFLICIISMLLGFVSMFRPVPGTN